MLDGGSGVNSIPEPELIKILNDHHAAGIPLSDPRHPVKVFEKFSTAVSLRGVASGPTVPLKGQVLMVLRFRALDKTSREIYIRLKICQAGATDWVPIIIGARALDCVDRGGLGFMPGHHGHILANLGIVVPRIEDPYDHMADDPVTYKGTKGQPVYAIRSTAGSCHSASGEGAAAADGQADDEEMRDTNGWVLAEGPAPLFEDTYGEEEEEDEGR